MFLIRVVKVRVRLRQLVRLVSSADRVVSKLSAFGLKVPSSIPSYHLYCGQTFYLFQQNFLYYTFITLHSCPERPEVGTTEARGQPQGRNSSAGLNSMIISIKKASQVDAPARHKLEEDLIKFIYYIDYSNVLLPPIAHREIQQITNKRIGIDQKNTRNPTRNTAFPAILV